MKKFIIAAAFTALAFVGFSSVASAATIQTNSSTAFTADEASMWSTDRHDTSSWTGGNEVAGMTDVLTAGVSGELDSAQSGANFYRTEGKKISVGSASSIESQLYIDPAWDNTAVRAGIWATSNAADAEWGIIEYTTANSYVAGSSTSLTRDVTFRTWDSNSGVWTPVSVAIGADDRWVTLKVVLADQWYYYINGNLVGQVALASVDSTTIKEVILNQYNYGFEVMAAEGDFGNHPYSVSWHGLNTGNSFSTIQDAIVASTPGTTILVNGTSTENVTVSKAVSIKGNGVGGVVGQITVNAASSTIDGLSISNPSGYFGVLINGVGNVTVSNNDISNIGTSLSSSQSYGVYFQDQDAVDASNVVVSGNTISNIGKTSTNFSSGGVGIGDSSGSGILGSFSIANNTIANVNSGKGAYGVLLNHAKSGSQTGTTADASVTGNTIKGLTGKWVHAIGLEGNTPNATVSNNSMSDLTVTSGSDVSPVFYEDNASQGTVSESGNSYSGPTLTVDPTASSSTPTTYTTGIDDPSISLDFLTTDGTSVTINTAIQSNVEVSAGSLSMTIPQGITITAASTWDGVIELPHISSETVNPAVVSGQEATIGVAIKVGSDVPLTFSKAVRLALENQAGKQVGFTQDGSTFTEIINICSADDQATVDAQLAAGSECKIEVADTLVVWTKHFTTFASYTVGNVQATPAAAVAVTSSSRGGTHSGGSAAVATAASTASTAGQVLGASNFRFTASLTVGSTGDSVMELQDRLRAAGYFSLSSTGYFGSVTQASVKAYQAKHGIPATGFVGPLTIAQLNADGEVSMPAMPVSATTSVSSSNGISAKMFVELLISSGAISAEKAEAARAAVK